MHLQRLQQIALHVLPHQLLGLRPRECNVSLLQERRDVSLCYLSLRVHPVLQLPQPLSRQPELGLIENIE